MHKTILVVAALVAIVFAGCSDAPPEQEVDDPDAVLDNPEEYYKDQYCVKNDVSPRVLAPDSNGFPWEIGDWWEYSLNVNGESQGKTKLIYYENQDFGSDGVPKHYMVGTPTRDEALQHALYGNNPVIGRVHQRLYSPHENGDHADMFNFPLCEGNSWTTRFYDTTFTYTVSESNGIFNIRGTASDGSTASHTFDPEVKWFTKIQVDRADGFKVRMDLTGNGEGNLNDAFFLRGQKDEIVDVAAINGQYALQRDEGGDGGYDSLAFSIDFERLNGANKVELHLRNPSGESVACVGYAGGPLTGGETNCSASGLIAEVDFVAGEWTLTVDEGGLGGAEVAGEVRITSIYDRSSTT